MAKRALQLRKTAESEIPKDNASADRLTVMSWQRVARCSLLMTVVSLSLSGCLLGPDYQRPDLALPARYNAPELGAATSAPASAPTATSASASGAVQAPVNAQWWTLFGDATLNQLVQAARQDNADIQVALARIRMTESLAVQAGAALYPTLNLTASGTRATSGPSVSVSGVGVQANTSQVGLLTSYELDVWGRVRRNIESATAVATGSQYEKDSVSLTVAALVSNLYLRLRSLDAQMAVLKDSVRTRTESVKVAEAKLQGGLVSPIDVNQGKAALAASQASLSEVTRQRAIVQNQLGVLTGKLDLTIVAGDVRQLPAPPLPPEGLPSTIVESRPDVNRAEQDLRAANARVGVATAGLFPTFSLVGLFGAQSVSFSSFLTDQSSVWSAGIGLLQPIFSGGLLQGRLEYAKAQQQEALGGYVKVVRNAFGEVSDALISVQQTLQTEQYLQQQVQASTKAQELAALRYAAGYVDFLNVLESQRVANEANLAFVINRSARLQASVDLFKALGGGWVAKP
jgi:multidrug efflux system outer membrane protein